MIFFIETFRRALMQFCLVGLAIVGLVYFVLVLSQTWRVVFAKMKSLHIIECIGAIFFVTILMVHAGTKRPMPHFFFETGLLNDGSYATNDLVHIEWVKSGTPYVPDAATLYVDCREIGSTNEWIELARGIVSDYRLDVTLANATNYNFNIWWYYESTDVHTNGVWKYTTIRAKANDPLKNNELKALPRRALTEGDGKVIATPGMKEKDKR